MAFCIRIGSDIPFNGKQAPDFRYLEGISVETVGSVALCMHKLIIPPGIRGTAHLHRNHETAIYLISGYVDTYWGDNLERYTMVGPGDFFYIPANVPHVPWNKTDKNAIAIVSRTDANEQESVELLPELEEDFIRRIKENAV